MADEERYADSFEETRRSLQAELGITVDPDDPMLFPAMIALAAIKRQESAYHDVARRAVDQAGKPLQETMQTQIEILRRIAGHFEAASTESRHIKDARTMLFEAINAMDADIKPLHSSMVLTRDALNKHEKISRSPFFLLLISAAFTAIGMTLGLIIGTQFL